MSCLSGLVKAYTSVLSLRGSPAISGASRCEEALGASGRRMTKDAAARAPATPTATSDRGVIRSSMTMGSSRDEETGGSRVRPESSTACSPHRRDRIGADFEKGGPLPREEPPGDYAQVYDVTVAVFPLGRETWNPNDVLAPEPRLPL